jgi:hypothetical protein
MARSFLNSPRKSETRSRSGSTAACLNSEALLPVSGIQPRLIINRHFTSSFAKTSRSLLRLAARNRLADHCRRNRES